MYYDTFDLIFPLPKLFSGPPPPPYLTNFMFFLLTIPKKPPLFSVLKNIHNAVAHVFVL